MLSSDAPTSVEETDSDIHSNDIVEKCEETDDTDTSMYFDFMGIAIKNGSVHAPVDDSGYSSHCTIINKDQNFHQIMDLNTSCHELFTNAPFMKKIYYTSDSESADENFQVSNYSAAKAVQVTKQVSRALSSTLTRSNNKQKTSKKHNNRRRRKKRKYKGKREIDDSDSSDDQQTESSQSNSDQDNSISTRVASSQVSACIQGQIYAQCVVDPNGERITARDKIYYDIWKIKLIIGVFCAFGSDRNPRHLCLLFYFNSLSFSNYKKIFFTMIYHLKRRA